MFFEGMDCVSMLLDCALASWGMMVRAILVGGCTIFFRGWRVYFAQYYMYRLMQNFGNCGICSVSERLWRCSAVIKLCEQFTHSMVGVILVTF